MENDRKRDLLERDAFAQRLIKKDKDKRKNVAEKSDKRAHEEAAKRLAIEAENRESLVNELRKESRRTYLSKRKEDKLNELKDDIMDDEFLFDEDQLTEKEKAERRYKKKVLELAVQHSKAGEIEKVQRYHMPEDRKDKKDKHFDEFDEKDKAPNYEQKRWEEEHLHSAQFNFGAKDAKVRHAMKEKQYDLLLDDEIEFIQALKMPGMKDEKDESDSGSDDSDSGRVKDRKPKKPLTEYEKKRQKIDETKKSLPVFPFREQLLEAIAGHQVFLTRPNRLLDLRRLYRDR